MALKQRFINSDFHRVFNFRTEESKGRSLMLINLALANIANAVISGALYTAFLAENGIDIVRVGIISLIPYISWLLSVFSPMVLKRFKRRQKALFLNDLIYYSLIVVATTVMPMFVSDPLAKTIWFGVFLFIANAVNAVIGTGYTTWQLRFVPEGRDLNVYVSYNNLVSIVLANSTGIIASFVAGMLAGSPAQMELLVWLRMGSFVLFMIGAVLIYLVIKEKPIEQDVQNVNLLRVITEPVKCRPFILTALITVFWGITTSLNGNTYTYYLLETVGVPIWLTYTGSLVSMVCVLTLSGRMRRYTDRTSPFRMLTVCILAYTLREAVHIFVAPGLTWLYVILSVVDGTANVAFSMGYNGLFYLHLPESGNKDVFSTFWNIAGNVSVFLGSAFGTWLLSLFEAHGVYCIMGMTFYGSQLLCVIKLLMFIGTLLYVRCVTPRLQHSRVLMA